MMFEWLTNPAPVGSLPSWLTMLVPKWEHPGTTVPIPPAPPSSAVPPPGIPPRTQADMGKATDRFGTFGIHDAIYGQPHLPVDPRTGMIDMTGTVGLVDPANAQPPQGNPQPPDDGVTRIRITPERRPIPASIPPAVNPAAAPGPPPGLAEGYDAVANTRTPPASPLPATVPPASKSSFDWGPDASLWGMLTSAGSAMMQPSYYGFGGQLSQGVGAASEYTKTEPQRQLLRAQVGKARADTATREFGLTLYNNKNLPMDIRMAAVFDQKKLPELFGKYGLDPNKAFYMEDGKIKANEPYINFQINKARASATYQISQIGRDQDGNPIYGVFDPGSGKFVPVNPNTVQGAMTNQPPAQGATPKLGEIPPPPPGVNPTEWRKTWADTEAKRQAAERASKASRDVSANIVVQDIDRVLKSSDKNTFWKTGPMGGLMSNIPGTGAFDMAKLLDSIKANTAFDKLQQMRQASPTGGALGQVSDKENNLLQAAVGALQQSQSFEQFQDNLKRVKNVYLDIIHGPGNGPAREKLGFQGAPASNGPKLPQGVTPTRTGTLKGRRVIQGSDGNVYYEDGSRVR